jgi:hypothetical protein
LGTARQRFAAGALAVFLSASLLTPITATATVPAVRGQVVNDAAHPDTSRTVTRASTTSRAAARPATTPTVAKAARGSNPTGQDLTAIKPSLYTGPFYDARFEIIRRCIVKREAEGDYTVVNSESRAAGAYQFMPGTSHVVATMIGRPDLRNVPANEWPRVAQDQGFWTLWDHGAGARHWANGRYDCWITNGV